MWRRSEAGGAEGREAHSGPHLATCSQETPEADSLGMACLPGHICTQALALSALHSLGELPNGHLSRLRGKKVADR